MQGHERAMVLQQAANVYEFPSIWAMAMVSAIV
jgi:hypothetical protein